MTRPNAWQPIAGGMVDLLADMAEDGGIVPVPANIAGELLRVYRAWLDAPVLWVDYMSDAVVTLSCEDSGGPRVRLISGPTP